MATTLPQNYPLATQDGKAIPLDVVKPISCMPVDITEGEIITFLLPGTYLILSIISNVDCILRLGEELLDGAFVNQIEITNAIFLQADTTYDIVIDAPANALTGLKTCSVLGTSQDGRMYINALQQWASLTQKQQNQIG